MAIYQIISVLILITAAFAYINHRWIKWPATIGIMALSLMFSLLMVIFGNLVPAWSGYITKLVGQINFEKVLMDVMLSFLLFAGAIHIDADKLKEQRWPVLVLATVGVAISTAIVSLLAYVIFGWFGISVPYIYCLLFGALISPTDPISVLGILKRVGVPKSLEMKIAGESLFNDGVGVVVFLTLLEIAAHGTENFSATGAAILFLREAGGGIIYGMLLGYASAFLMRTIDNYNVELLINLAVVTVGYQLANEMHISAPLAIIMAGIIIGTKSRQGALSPESIDTLGKFWELIDELFNAVLFLLMGMGLLVIKITPIILVIGGIMIFVVLLARWVAVWLPVKVLQYKIKFEPYAVTILTWGGLRGGLSVAMALSLPAHMYRSEFVLITYVVVVFSVIVQGLTIGKLTARLQSAN
jgi:CPA1 family monovalent cation:H+ antiporter